MLNQWTRWVGIAFTQNIIRPYMLLPGSGSCGALSRRKARALLPVGSTTAITDLVPLTDLLVSIVSRPVLVTVRQIPPGAAPAVWFSKSSQIKTPWQAALAGTAARSVAGPPSRPAAAAASGAAPPLPPRPAGAST